MAQQSRGIVKNHQPMTISGAYHVNRSVVQNGFGYKFKESIP
jgi:hypothetical protein